jgi:transposase-like protein
MRQELFMARRKFNPEFKTEAVRLARIGDRSIEQIAKDLDLTESSLRNWVRQAEVDAARPLLATKHWPQPRRRSLPELPRIKRASPTKAGPCITVTAAVGGYAHRMVRGSVRACRSSSSRRHGARVVPGSSGCRSPPRAAPWRSCAAGCGTLRGCGLRQSRHLRRRSESLLKHRFVKMVPIPQAGARMTILSRCGKGPLPRPLARSVRILRRQRARQLDVPRAIFEVTLVLSLDVREVFAQRLTQLVGQQGESVLLALALTYDEMARTEVEIFDAQLSALEQA